MGLRIARLAFFLALLPGAVVSASVAAGFAPGAVWLSKTNVQAGESVQIYTVLYDSASSPIAGNVSFLVDGSSIASQPFDLAAGTTKIVSASWNAVQGSHSISAALDGVINKDTGEALALASVEATPLTIEIAAPPPPSPVAQAISDAISAVQGSAPVVAGAAQSAYDSLEYLRQHAVHTLESALAKANAPSSDTAPSSHILGTSTVNVAATNAGGFDLGDAANSLWRLLLSALLYISQIQYLFYAALLIVAYVVYKLLRTMLFERRHPFQG